MTPYLALQVLAFGVVTFRATGVHTFADYQHFFTDADHLFTSAAVAAVAPLVSLILLGAVPNGWKLRLIFWRWQNPSPGCRAFTVYGPKDGRITIERLVPLLHGNISPNHQNEVWYRLLKKHEASVKVLGAHRDYIAVCEIAVLSLLLAGILPALAALFTGWQVWLIWYAMCELFLYAMSCLAAQNLGVRLVTTVLACE